MDQTSYDFLTDKLDQIVKGLVYSETQYCFYQIKKQH